jgi:hypothetical protein
MLDSSQVTHTDSKPQAIEKILHKYEMEIRSHTKMEKEFKRLVEEADRRYDNLKREYGMVTTKYNEMMIRLSDLSYANDNLLEENCALKRFLVENQIEIRDVLKRASKNKSGVSKDKSQRNTRRTSTDFIKMKSSKLLKVD